MDALESKLTRALADLGDSPEAVAAVLEANGCRGQRMSAGYCPVATYLKRTLAVRFVNVDSAECRAVPEGPIGQRSWYTVDTPPAVGAFVDRFDRGHFARLETPNVF